MPDRTLTLVEEAFVVGLGFDSGALPEFCTRSPNPWIGVSFLAATAFSGSEAEFAPNSAESGALAEAATQRSILKGIGLTIMLVLHCNFPPPRRRKGFFCPVPTDDRRLSSCESGFDSASG